MAQPPGKFYLDDEGCEYEILQYLGDFSPVFQVFQAQRSRIVNGERVSEAVVMKIARPNVNSAAGFLSARFLRIDAGFLSDAFHRMKDEIDRSFKIGDEEDPQNNVISDGSRIIGIYKQFQYKDFYCVTMPYFEGGSLRHLINSRMTDRRVADKHAVAVVLRETCRALCFLHSRGKVHTKLNAGNIFISNIAGGACPELKLAWLGSIYFHYPEISPPGNVWDLDPKGLKDLFLIASNILENKIWREDMIYEPNIDEQVQDHFTPASDIWNFGVTALELALGPLDRPFRPKRTPGQLRSFLLRLSGKDECLPTLNELFLIPPTAAENAAHAEPLTPPACTNVTTQSMKSAAESAIKAVVERISIAKKNKSIEFSTTFMTMVKRCLSLDPEARPTAEMLLNEPFFVKHGYVDMDHFARVLRTQDLGRRRYSY